MITTNPKIRFILLLVIFLSSFNYPCISQTVEGAKDKTPKEKVIEDFMSKLNCTKEEATLIVDAAITFILKIESDFNRIATGDTLKFNASDKKELLGYFDNNATVQVSVIGKKEKLEFSLEEYISRLGRSGKKQKISILFNEDYITMLSPVDLGNDEFEFSTSVVQIFKAISLKSDKINYADVCKKIFNFKGEFIDGVPVLKIRFITVTESIPMKDGWQQKIRTIKN